MSAPLAEYFAFNSAGSYPPTALATGATISTTGAVNLTFTPSGGGGFYLYGLAFKDAVGQSSSQNITLTANGSWIYCDACSFEIATTSATGTLSVVGSGSGTTIFNNTTVKFAHTSQSLTVSGQFFWQNTGTILVSGSSVPTALMVTLSSALSFVVLEALDLSQLTGNIMSASGATQQGQLLVKDCKLNASTTIPMPGGFGSTFQVVRCDSGAPAYKSARYQYEGTETTETTIVRTGGATDPAGQTQSRKIVTTANVQWLRPFKAEPYAVWNATSGTVTATIYGNAATLPLNDEVWAEFEFLGSGSTTLGSVVTTTKANILATGASVASDASTWGGGTTPFKLTATLTPGQAGYIHARVRVAKASATYYIDPQIYLS